MHIFEGIFSFTFFEHLFVALLLTHITIVAVTIFLHRAQAHRALVLHPLLAHFFRLWLWLTTGMVTKEWVAIHRKHHARCEMEGDPHSPIVWLSDVTGRWSRAIHMCWFVLFAGVRMYVHESRVKETIEKRGTGTPNDWIERSLYSRFPKLGILVMMTADIVFLGMIPGLVVWIIQMIWIPIFAAGVINGVGHFIGYRNVESRHRRTGIVDSSRNILPWGVLIGGEELHNNHHADELSAKLSMKWYEFDIGWLYIRIFQVLGLVTSIRQKVS